MVYIRIYFRTKDFDLIIAFYVQILALRGLKSQNELYNLYAIFKSKFLVLIVFFVIDLVQTV